MSQKNKIVEKNEIVFRNNHDATFCFSLIDRFPSYFDCVESFLKISRKIEKSFVAVLDCLILKIMFEF